MTEKIPSAKKRAEPPPNDGGAGTERQRGGSPIPPRGKD